MRIISIKTKIEVMVAIFFLMLLAFASVVSVTRTISDTHDDIYTFIRNSNGNYWEATGSNIQAAIDDLSIQPPPNQGWGGVHGTVWLPGNTVINTSSTIIIGPHITLDMGGCCLIPDGDFEVVNLTIGSAVKNGCINVSNVADYSSNCIGFNSHDRLHMQEHHPRVHNMELISDNQKGTGILLQTWGSEFTQYIVFAEICNIRVEEFEYGIFINHSTPTGSWDAYINGNTFSNIVGYGCKYFIKVYEYAHEASGNYFYNVQCYCTSDTECIIWNNGHGNVYDTVIAYDWDNNSGTRTSYNFSVNVPGDSHYAAHQCFLSYIGGGSDIAIGAWDPTGPNANRYTILDLEKSKLTIGYVNQVG